ncbi:formate dehydrogenase accessory sulfurtransferase FdhD [Microlunatus sp. Gsoil 973]|uniref:formate dehydrogenase accessory sulfurtransferase FdhD n=1 Tax=Microlunatus sp. Gsoil 973 TaxID=2672569 RepID=UPI0012B4F5E4|nr:formate dehydrogenase accessory sulfurtransferase FdhD [Microlunatus sp. Gsoil 973]QGN31992.1 formate dehydrogenase accessory sulfurtransferase FdhD [Microlunatus sp. Gsoil 973]
MARAARQHLVRRLTSDGWSPRSDRLAVEEPLEIRLGGESFAVTMRTPGHDIDLVNGWCFAEGIIQAAADITTARYCDGAGPDGLNTYNVIDVDLAAGVGVPDPGLRRNVLTTSACGICGTTSIDQVLGRAAKPLEPGPEIAAELIAEAPDLLRSRQQLFAGTGGVHAAGLLTTAGDLICVREDVGRHNAVDKVVGHALRSELLPLRDCLLVVSGRASFELTQKAVMAGIPALVAVSAPSSLAVDLADRAGLTLVGFARGDTLNVYTHPDRIVTG